MKRANKDSNSSKTNRKNNKVSVKKACRFCIDDENVISYKRSKMLTHFISDRCKITPRRVTGNCQFHQKRIVESIKRARHLALLPYTVQHALRH